METKTARRVRRPGGLRWFELLLVYANTGSASSSENESEDAEDWLETVLIMFLSVKRRCVGEWTRGGRSGSREGRPDRARQSAAALNRRSNGPMNRRSSDQSVMAKMIVSNTP